MRTEDVVRSLARDVAPVRRLPRPEVRSARWAIFAVACVSAGTLLLGPRPDLPSRLHDPRFVLQNALLLVIFVASLRIAFDLSVPGAERAVTARALPLWGLLIWTWMLVDAGAAPAGAGWRCVLRMACLAIVPCVAALRMLRKAAPLEPAWTAFFTLLAAVSAATVGMQMMCTRDDPPHVFWWHLVPAILIALAGAYVCKRALSAAAWS